MTEATRTEETVENPPCGPSSLKLVTDVANFMERADEIVTHPLAQQEPNLELLLHFDPVTAVVQHMSMDLKNLDKATWLYLAMLMRPIVFNEKDPLSFVNLTVAIGFEHESVRERLKVGRKGFAAWKKHMYIGQQALGPVAEDHKGLPSGTITMLATQELKDGEEGTLDQHFDLSGMVPDYVFADIYFNGMVWHSDTAKAAAYQEASPTMRAYYAKCAEIRTITAIKHVKNLRTFIFSMREHGHSI